MPTAEGALATSVSVSKPAGQVDRRRGSGKRPQSGGRRERGQESPQPRPAPPGPAARPSAAACAASAAPAALGWPPTRSPSTAWATCSFAVCRSSRASSPTRASASSASGSVPCWRCRGAALPAPDPARRFREASQPCGNCDLCRGRRRTVRRHDRRAEGDVGRGAYRRTLRHGAPGRDPAGRAHRVSEVQP